MKPPVTAITIILLLAGCWSAAEHPPTSSRSSVEAAETRLADDIQVRRVAPGLWAHVTWKTFENENGSAYPSNGMLLETPEGSILVDTGWDDRQTEILLTWAAERLQRPVRTAIITHAHEDRLGGMRALVAAGVRASGLALTGALARAQGVPAPNVIPGLEQAPRTTAGGLQLYYPGPGHAPDNIIVYFPAQRVLFGGCLIKPDTATTLGNTADADPAHWPEAVRKVREQFPDVVTVVPGHGAIGGPVALAASERLLRRLLPGHGASVRERTAPPQLPVVAVAGPTVIAFWLVPASDSVLIADSNLASALDDQQYYWADARPKLAQAGVAAIDQPGRRFLVREPGREWVFAADPDSSEVGYLLVQPGREPHVLYGVRFPDELLATARAYFAPAGPQRRAP